MGGMTTRFFRGRVSMVRGEKRRGYLAVIWLLLLPKNSSAALFQEILRHEGAIGKWIFPFSVLPPSREGKKIFEYSFYSKREWEMRYSWRDMRPVTMDLASGQFFFMKRAK
jgi:hypothetical protein